MLQFRRAVSKDVTDIVVLVESAYRGEVSQQGWTTEADLLDGQRTDAEEVADILARPFSLFLLGVADAELQACVRLDHDGTTCRLGMFAIRPDLQGRGTGTLVLSRAERLAKEELGCDSVELEVLSAREELVAWYRRRGYLETGQRRPFPYGNPRAGIPKRHDLEFLVLRKPL